MVGVFDHDPPIPAEPPFPATPLLRPAEALAEADRVY